MTKLIEIAIKASLEAGRAIMEVYNSAFDVEYKDDMSPITEADKQANNIINNFLLPTKIPIISEENQQINYAIRKKWDRCWIVDPVDGTKEFVNRNGEFTVNIALIEHNKPILGVIYAPAIQVLYFGNVLKKEAFKVELESTTPSVKEILNNAKLIKPHKSIAETIKLLVSRSHQNQLTLDYIKDLKQTGKQVEIVSTGSSLKFCLIADGKANLYPRFSPTMEWDTAAGQAICNAVDVNVNSITTGQALIYNKKELLNPWFKASKQS